MAYGLIIDFIYDVGEGVGEFLPDDEKAQFTPLSLDQIVKNYIDERNLLNVFFLKRQIKRYIKNHMTSEGLEYVAPPFGQETSFVEDYFDGDLHVFLTNVVSLLDKEYEVRVQNFLSKFTRQG
ncbi:hypothetical protein ALO42_102313 [Pseudomonas syringae pv. atrofaciens]|uniref:Uncharacterized protein n=1 Tax=Pseudomonas syringae pv. atrofaciens TaxID=192087 RepID=A0A0P9IW20_PSESX|nr:hypothetical protein [Pseudomonas syringae]AVX24135.1 hypothetical protein DA456_12400 [Pseudomonas syringae pv. atrofaciens]ELQ03449.1 hypothetical protein A979_05995 [Pseudomonas syringae BRIP34876]ELQ03697.1 hypothetical protein A987_10397 [Pseudomonas syringae BRIP34881]KPW14419.1 hypothetical protein ALO42_102313 [Pseudomonas syringae pv. atrofaciens]MCF5653232.1 hypothetical protein [Pseudomonas syringae]